MVLDLSIFANQSFLIPFLFVLAIVFGILELANIFGNRAVNMIIAIVIAFFSATYQPFTSLLFQYLPTITWFFIAMFFIAFSLEIIGLGKRKSIKEESMKMIILGVVLIVFITIGVNYIPDINFLGTQNLLIIIALFLMFMLFSAAHKIPAEGS